LILFSNFIHLVKPFVFPPSLHLSFSSLRLFHAGQIPLLSAYHDRSNEWVCLLTPSPPFYSRPFFYSPRTVFPILVIRTPAFFCYLPQQKISSKLCLSNGGSPRPSFPTRFPFERPPPPHVEIRSHRTSPFIFVIITGWLRAILELPIYLFLLYFFSTVSLPFPISDI